MGIQTILKHPGNLLFLRRYNLIASTLRRHPAYITWYIGVARFFTACLMPVVTLLVLNGAIIRRIR